MAGPITCGENQRPFSFDFNEPYRGGPAVYIKPVDGVYRFVANFQVEQGTPTNIFGCADIVCNSTTQPITITAVQPTLGTITVNNQVAGPAGSCTVLELSGGTTVVGAITQSTGKRFAFTITFATALEDGTEIYIDFWDTQGKHQYILIGYAYASDPCSGQAVDIVVELDKYFAAYVCPPNWCEGTSAGVYVNGVIVGALNRQNGIDNLNKTVATHTYTIPAAANSTYTAIVVDGISQTISVAADGANPTARLAAAAVALTALGFGPWTSDATTLTYTGTANLGAINIGATAYAPVLTDVKSYAVEGFLQNLSRNCNCPETFALNLVFPAGVQPTDSVEWRGDGGEVVPLNLCAAPKTYTFAVGGTVGTDPAVITGLNIGAQALPVFTTPFITTGADLDAQLLNGVAFLNTLGVGLFTYVAASNSIVVVSNEQFSGLGVSIDGVVQTVTLVVT